MVRLVPKIYFSYHFSLSLSLSDVIGITDVMWSSKLLINFKRHASFNYLSILDDNLLIGTREGHLLMYNVPSKSHNHHQLELLGHNKNFNKKRIIQVDVVPEYSLLVLLTGMHNFLID